MERSSVIVSIRYSHGRSLVKTAKCLVIAAGTLCVLLMPKNGILEKIDPETLDVLPEPEDALYNRAPDPLPWISGRMLEPDFWIGRMERPDEVIMSPAEIRRMNENWKKRIAMPDPFAREPEHRKPKLIHWWPGFSLNNPDLSAVSPSAAADTVKSRIRDEIAYLHKQEYGNCLAIKYSGEEVAGFEREMALERVGSAVTVGYGIAVRPSRLRNIPSFFPQQLGLVQSRKTRWDLWNIGVIKIGRPVQVLHRSLSGEYLFVLSGAGYGWVRAENIAFGTRKAIDDFANAPDFAVSTASRTLFYTDATCSTASGWFGMGTRLPLAEKGDKRRVRVPVRRMDGSFGTDIAWIADNDDASIGYLPYTRRNIIQVAFRLLGEPYDWSGAWFGRQHEKTYNDIFACFGFELPNHGTLFTYFNDNNTLVLDPAEGKEAYYRKVAANEPFVTIQSCGGHCQLYIGEVDGRPIVFDQHGYGYPDDDGVWWEVRRCNIGDLRLPRYFLLREVTFLELR